MTTHRPVLAVCGVLFAVLSWVVLRLANLGARGLVALDALLRLRKPTEWQLLSADAIRKPLTLPVIMTTAPRWNPHAAIATIRPVRIRRMIRVHDGAASPQGGGWTLVVHRFPGTRIVRSINSTEVRSNGGDVVLDVSPGTYSFALRYYGWSPGTQLPAVRVDDREVASALAIPADLNDRLYQELARRTHWSYAALHYYIYPMLRWRHRLPRRSVERELLPVGNPETRFSYGHLPAGAVLELQATNTLLAESNVYLTVYGRNSFPVQWERMTSSNHLTEPFEQDTFYVVRVHSSGGARAVTAVNAGDLRSTVIRQPTAEKQDSR